MKKYVVSRIVDTARVTTSDKERPRILALRPITSAVCPRRVAAEPTEPEPLPVFGVLQALVDQAYGVRSGKPVCVGRVLNVAV